MRNTAALIIDMQPNYLRSIEPGKLDDLLAQQLMLLQYCATVDIPAITVEMISGQETDGRISAASLLVPRNSLCRKPSSDAFSCAYLEPTLHALGIRNLVLAGIYQSECVYATAASAVRRYHVWTSPALMADSEAPECVSTQGQVTPPSIISAEWFARNTNHHPNVASLLRALD